MRSVLKVDSQVGNCPIYCLLTPSEEGGIL
jgi:hypothetical protein